MTQETGALRVQRCDTNQRLPRPTHNQSVGQAGEEAAAAYLRDLGWIILARNWRCRSGEVDIAARDGHTLVIVEVKSRLGRRYGRAIESVTTEKVQRLRRLSAQFASEHQVRASRVRIDVIGMEWSGAAWHIDHRRGVSQ